MTTLVVDFEEQKIYTDTQLTKSNPLRTERNIFKELFNIGKSAHDCWGRGYDKVTKAWVIDENTLYTGTGDYDLICEMRQHFENERGLPDINTSGYLGTTLLTLTKVGDKVVLNSYEVVGDGKTLFGNFKYKWEHLTYRNVQRYHTYGSGMDFARGALNFGATPEEAIIAASKTDLGTNDKVECLGFTTKEDE